MKSALSRTLIACVTAAMALAACGGAAPTQDAKPAETAASAPTEAAVAQPTEATMDKPTEAAIQKPTEAATAKSTESASGDETVSNSLAWFATELTDVNSGQTFTLNDFHGQIVLVEGMAVWCTNCLSQQRELVRLHEQIGDAAISVAIDVDLNEDEALLRQHAEVNGFDWRYAVASPELAQALAAEFGNAFLNPPSVPMFLIDKEGAVHLLDFGHKSTDYLTAQIQSYQ
jgi:thiol-disulfide isomerase/thioredoxin